MRDYCYVSYFVLLGFYSFFLCFFNYFVYDFSNGTKNTYTPLYHKQFIQTIGKM